MRIWIHEVLFSNFFFRYQRGRARVNWTLTKIYHKSLLKTRWRSETREKINEKIIFLRYLLIRVFNVSKTIWWEVLNALTMRKTSISLSVCLSICLSVCLSVTILSVTILKKKQIKQKTIRARMLIFSVKGTIFCPSLFLSVTILKNPYKTQTNQARILNFSVKGTYHGRSLP